MADKLDAVTGKDSLRKYFDTPYMGAYSISIDAEPILTINKVLHGKITLDGGRKEEHLLLSFQEKSVPGMDEVKDLVLNATNQKTLEKLYGKGADALIGKKIQLYVDPNVKAIGGGTTEGVRIRFTRPVSKETTFVCEDCKQKVAPSGDYSAAQIASVTQRRYGVTLCAECSAKRKAVTDKEQTDAAVEDKAGTEVNGNAATD